VKRDVAAFMSGLVFAIGLVVSGMTQPSKVLAFLDVTGAWDPSLALVILGAIAISALAFRASARWRSPAFGDRFDVPPRRSAIDGRLVAGAAIFGVGWGLSGLCPGPAVVSVASGQSGSFVFLAAMVAGVALQGAIERFSRARWRFDASREQPSSEGDGAP
jgi:uncharacterized membrane protein YedE/YeeE